MIPLLAIGITGCDSSSDSATSGNTTSGVSGTFTDSRDGQTYKYVKIGTQTWMAQNLNYKVDSSWCYDDSAANCVKYGRLYQWAAVMGLDTGYNHKFWQGADSAKHQGICPSSWHVPTDTEWGTLIAYVGKDSARIKLSSTSDWDTTYYKGANAYGFNVLPTGVRSCDGTFGELSDIAGFRSSSDYGFGFTAGSWYFYYFGYAGVDRSGYYKSLGLSLRCIQN